MSARLVVWRIEDTAGFDQAWLVIADRRVTMDGTAVAWGPDAVTSYRLETDEDGATVVFDVEVRTADGVRRLELRRGPDGWTADGASRPDLAAAVDVDLASCPATNTMPIVRHGLHRGPGEARLTMAFVRLPSLQVVPHAQRYQHLALRTEGGAVVRYSSERFTADLLVDADGVVIDYPQLGTRIGPPTR